MIKIFSLSLLFIFLALETEALELKAGFSRVSVSAEDMQKMVEASQSKTEDQFLAKISAQFPELVIIVGPRTLKDTPAVIQWRDPKISESDSQWYLDKSQKVSKFEMAHFLAPQDEPEGMGRARPFVAQPVVYLKENCPHHIIQHELMHYFIYKARAQKYPAGNSRRRDRRDSFTLVQS